MPHHHHQQQHQMSVKPATIEKWRNLFSDWEMRDSLSSNCNHLVQLIIENIFTLAQTRNWWCSWCHNGIPSYHHHHRHHILNQRQFSTLPLVTSHKFTTIIQLHGFGFTTLSFFSPPPKFDQNFYILLSAFAYQRDDGCKKASNFMYHIGV